MAAEEDEPEAVVGKGLRLGPGLRFRLDQQMKLRPEGPGPAQGVERVVPGGGRQPGAGPVRYAAASPVDEGGGVRVLDALLRQVEVAGDAYRRGEHRGPLATVRVLDRELDRVLARDPDPSRVRGPVRVVRARCHPTGSSGRTSTAPSMIGSNLPMASAVSKSSVSTTKNPAITSLLSMNGPSVTSPSL